MGVSNQGGGLAAGPVPAEDSCAELRERCRKLQAAAAEAEAQSAAAKAAADAAQKACDAARSARDKAEQRAKAAAGTGGSSIGGSGHPGKSLTSLDLQLQSQYEAEIRAQMASGQLSVAQGQDALSHWDDPGQWERLRQQEQERAGAALAAAKTAETQACAQADKLASDASAAAASAAAAAKAAADACAAAAQCEEARNRPGCNLLQYLNPGEWMANLRRPSAAPEFGPVSDDWGSLGSTPGVPLPAIDQPPGGLTVPPGGEEPTFTAPPGIDQPVVTVTDDTPGGSTDVAVPLPMSPTPATTPTPDSLPVPQAPAPSAGGDETSPGGWPFHIPEPDKPWPKGSESPFTVPETPQPGGDDWGSLPSTPGLPLPPIDQPPGGLTVPPGGEEPNFTAPPGIDEPVVSVAGQTPGGAVWQEVKVPQAQIESGSGSTASAPAPRRWGLTDQRQAPSVTDFLGDFMDRFGVFGCVAAVVVVAAVLLGGVGLYLHSRGSTLPTNSVTTGTPRTGGSTGSPATTTGGSTGAVLIAQNEVSFVGNVCQGGTLHLSLVIDGIAPGTVVVVDLSGAGLPASVTFMANPGQPVTRDFPIRGAGEWTDNIVSIGGKAPPSAGARMTGTWAC